MNRRNVPALAARLATLLAALAVSVPVHPSDLEAAVRALGRADYARAKSILEPLAHAGDLGAQGLLAHTYLNQERYLDAYAWFHAAAGCGSIDARLDAAALERKMSPAAIEKATARGEALLAEHCPSR